MVSWHDIFAFAIWAQFLYIIENDRMDKAIKSAMSANGKSDGGNGENVPPSSDPRGTGTGPQCVAQGSWSSLEGTFDGDSKFRVFSAYVSFSY